MMRKISLIVVVVLIIKLSYAFDLSFAYSNSLDYNADYLAQIASNQANQESLVQGRAQLLPQLSANATLTENYLGVSGGITYYHQPTLGANFSQVVFDFGKFSQYTKSKYMVQVSALQLLNAKQQLIVTVAQAYFDVLYARDVLYSIKITKDALAKQLDQAKKSFAAGTVTIADVNDAKSGFDSAVAQEIQAINDLINKENIFHNITGLDPKQIQPLATVIELTTPSNPNTVDAWSSLAKVNNTNIKVAVMQLEMANQDINIATAGHVPTLNVVGNYQYQAPGGTDGGNTSANQSSNIPGTPLSDYSTAALGLQLNLPIYSGGLISSQVRQYAANYRQSQQQLLSVQRQTDQNIRNAFWQVENGVSIVKAQTQALKSAKIKLQSDRLGYQTGVRNSIDLVNSERNYATVLQNYNLARYQYLVYRLQLQYLAGKIDQNYLKLINSNIVTEMARNY